MFFCVICVLNYFWDSLFLLFLQAMREISGKYYSIFCKYLQNAVPFVAYRLPETAEICVFVADSVERFIFSGQENIFLQEGFLVVPFDNENRVAYWLKNVSASLSDRTREEASSSVAERSRSAKTDYFSNFNKIHSAIKKGEISKAVLSHRHEIENISAETAVACFLYLCKEKSSSYNYLLHLPEVGVWVGSSPELFLKKDEQMIETVSLAGTVVSPNPSEGGGLLAHPTSPLSGGLGRAFSIKEIKEQEIVSDYVSEVLAEFGVKNPAQNDSIGVSGNIAHLKTSFRFPKAELKGSFGNLVEALHPTPAVCGYPKMKSKQLILSTETHNASTSLSNHRSLYSGFLGKVESDGQCALFVNIRCVQFIDNKAIVYAGAGITDKSDAQSEWNETELKLDNILISTKLYEFSRTSCNSFHS